MWGGAGWAPKVHQIHGGGDKRDKQGNFPPTGQDEKKKKPEAKMHAENGTAIPNSDPRTPGPERSSPKKKEKEREKGGGSEGTEDFRIERGSFLTKKGQKRG